MSDDLVDGVRRNLEVDATVVAKYAVLQPVLDERPRRLWAAAESWAIGFGGDTPGSAATGLARDTIRRGRQELAAGVAGSWRIRRPGAGRPVLEAKQSVRTSREGTSHLDRNAQFGLINATAAVFLQDRQPVISVDTKKKELVRDFKKAGREWHPAGQSETARVHDFPRGVAGKVIPYGVYAMARTQAWVSVGRDHDTLAFAAASMWQWWTMMGRRAYPKAIDITADSGGSDGYRARAWKTEVQALADALQLQIHVPHFPPGASKWNKIEPRLFCHITRNWRGKPLRTFETVVESIGQTRTAAGLRVRATLDPTTYPTGVVVPRAQMDELSLHPHDFHGEWDYELRPRRT